MKAILFLVVVAPLCAHDLYLMPRQFRPAPGDSLLISAHVGDGFPESEGPLDPQRLVESRWSTGESIEGWRILGKATHVVTQPSGPGSRYAVITTKPRRIELVPAKFESYLREEGLASILEWRERHQEAGSPGRELYSKYAKTLVTVGEASNGWRQPAGVAIEFVPEKDPACLRPGEILPVRLLLHGRPLEDTQVAVSWDGGHRVAGRTDAAGRIVVPIEAAGRHRLRSVTMKRVGPGKDVDWESFWASLTFEVAAR
jgi:hypothetical protein